MIGEDAQLNEPPVLNSITSPPKRNTMLKLAATFFLVVALIVYCKAQSDIGKYELAPGFILTISKDRDQPKAKATGQPQFPIFAKSHNVFYFKVVEAQRTFNQNSKQEVESVTLHQAGRELVGKRVE